MGKNTYQPGIVRPAKLSFNNKKKKILDKKNKRLDLRHPYTEQLRKDIVHQILKQSIKKA